MITRALVAELESHVGNRAALVAALRYVGLEMWLDVEAWAATQPVAIARDVLAALVELTLERLIGQRLADPPAAPRFTDKPCVVCGKPTGSDVSAYCSPECAYSDH